MAKKSKKKLFLSVVVITHNGATTIRQTLNSIFAQDFPRSRYEVIVVNDGSTDNTQRILAAFPDIRYVHHEVNQGISAARNSGLAAAKGEVYVAVDDDCIYQPNWMRELAKGYDLPHPLGVGGQLIAAQQPRTLLRKFLNATETGLPPRIRIGSQSFAKRLGGYLREVFAKPSPEAAPFVVVEEIYGLNSSFLIEALKEVDGWDLAMSGIEDRDISHRLRERYPNRALYAMSGAKLLHQPRNSLWKHLLRSYRRGPQNYLFHRRFRIVSPVYPFPILVVVATIVGGLFNLWPGLVALLILPQLLYVHWLGYGLRTGQLSYLLLAYIKLLDESLVMLGLFRGFLLRLQQTNRYTRKLYRWPVLVTALAIASWAVIQLQGWSSYALTGYSLLFLLLLPGYLLLRTIAGYTIALGITRIIALSAGLSIISLMILGLSLNELYVLVGKSHPFEVRPLTALLTGFTTALLVASAFRRPDVSWRLSDGKRLLRQLDSQVLLAVALPLMAIAGAIKLNHGGSNWLALAATGLAAVWLIYLVWTKKTSIQRRYPLALYSICLTILFGVSMRGWLITGHDVMQEYQVYQLTLQHAAWHMSYYQDAYTACLSITILPTIIQKLTHLSDPYVFKIAFQAFFALIAPVLYVTFRRYTTRKAALLAAFVFMTFPAFLTDIAMLNRQETALFCLASAFMVGTMPQLGRRAKSLLLLILLSGMVLSHYSTSYVAVSLLIFVLLAQLVLRLIRRLRKQPPLSTTGLHTPLFSPFIILFTIVLLVGWGSFATRTSDNISRTIGDLATSIPRLLQTQTVGYSQNGTAVVHGSLLQDYLKHSETARPLPASDYYKDGIRADATIKSSADTVAPLAPFLQHHGVSTQSVYSLIDNSRQAYAVIVEALLAFGVLLILLVRRYRDSINHQYKLLITGSFLMIAIQVVLPAPVIDYGLLRVIQQGLLVLSLPAVLYILWLLGLLHLPSRWRLRISGLLFVALFLLLSGFIPSLTGGFKPALAYSNSGFYYEAYYGRQADVTAERWLLAHTPKGSRVYSDEFARRQMIAYTGIFSEPVLVPGAIPVDSYVFLSTGNTMTGHIPLYYNGTLIYYKIPYDFLNSHKHLLYNVDGVKIYR